MNVRFEFQEYRHFYVPLVLIIISVLSSCTPDPLELEGIGSTKSEIVVSSQILPDGALAVFLTKTFTSIEHIGNDQGSLEKLAVDDAIVTVSTENRTYALEHVEHGVYVGIKLPLKIGKEYSLNVHSRSMGRVSAKTKLQPGVLFDTVHAKLLWTDETEPFAEVKYEITDPKGKNFYMLNVQGSRKQQLYSNVINPDTYTRVLEDKDFNEKKFSEQFTAINKKFYPGDSIAVSITAISEDYFKYLKMRIDNNNELTAMFSEPVHYPSNVIGGRGFFNLHYPDGRVLVLE